MKQILDRNNILAHKKEEAIYPGPLCLLHMSTIKHIVKYETSACEPANLREQGSRYKITRMITGSTEEACCIEIT